MRKLLTTLLLIANYLKQSNLYKKYLLPTYYSLTTLCIRVFYMYNVYANCYIYV